MEALLVVGFKQSNYNDIKLFNQNLQSDGWYKIQGFENTWKKKFGAFYNRVDVFKDVHYRIKSYEINSGLSEKVYSVVQVGKGEVCLL